MITNIENLINEPLNIRYEMLKKILKEHDIRVSHQRLLILDYLICNEVHPTADDIYKSLKVREPVISQATVYNTLNLLVENNLISELDFNQPSKRYDFYKPYHCHFICNDCGNIIDLHIEEDSIQFQELKDCQISSMDIIVRGKCPECKKHNKK